MGAPGEQMSQTTVIAWTAPVDKQSVLAGSFHSFSGGPIVRAFSLRSGVLSAPIPFVAPC